MYVAIDQIVRIKNTRASITSSAQKKKYKICYYAKKTNGEILLQKAGVTM